MNVYNKLVRDKIPEIITAKGDACNTEVLSAIAYQERLEAKLREECAEYLASKEPEELADILEVVYALAATQGVSREVLENLRSEKAEARGAFDKRLLLKEVWKGE